MANKVLLKKSSVAAKVPLPSDLSYGELAVNYADAKLYFKDTVNAIQYFVSTGSTDTLTNKTLTSPAITTPTITGLSAFTATTAANAVNITYNPTATTGAALFLTGKDSQGGTGYFDFLKATNTTSGATNPNKSFRLNSTGAVEIVNSAYTATIFSLTDAGAVTFGGTTFPTTNGTNGYVLTSNGTGGSSWTAVAGGGSMTYPGAGIPNSTGTAWGTSYTTTGSGTVVALATSPAFTTSITTGSTSFDILNTTATTVNAFGASTATTLGAATGTFTVNSITLAHPNATLLTMNGASPSITTTSTGTASVFNTNALTGNLFGAATTVSIGASTGTTTINNNVTVTGNLTVNGTTTTLNATTITVDDKNIELGSVASPTDATADGGGITLKGATDKTVIWDQTNTNWTSSENWNLATGKTFKINNVGVLSSTQVLGKTIGGTSAGDIVSIDGTQTLTNKTLSSAVITGTVTAGGSVGTAGYVLSSTGTGVQWIAQSGGGGSTVLYTSQSLSTAQQDQARSNIYAASPDDAIIYSMIF
jgi:hypothetical protein